MSRSQALGKRWHFMGWIALFPLITLLLLPACNQTTEITQPGDTPVLAFHIVPEQGLVTQAEAGTASGVTTLANGQQLVNDLLTLDSIDYWFEGNKLILEAGFTNISSSNLYQPFSFEVNPATSNIVSSVETHRHGCRSRRGRNLVSWRVHGGLEI